MYMGDLAAIRASMESKASVSNPRNDTPSGEWLRIALAAEALAGASTSANEGIHGYMKRAAVALESLSATSGAEENDTYYGLLKRIVDALEVKSGAVGTSSLEDRAKTAAANASFVVNLFTTFTSELDNAAWIKSAATIVANVEGSADRLVPDATAARHFAYRVHGETTVQAFTVAADLKASGNNFGAVGLTNSAGLWGVFQFNLGTGALSGAYGAGALALPTGSITPLGSGWYRCRALFGSVDTGQGISATVMATFGGDAIFEGVAGNAVNGVLVRNILAAKGSFANA